MRVLIVGCGYVGLPLGAALVAKGHTVYGMRRSLESAEELESMGVVPVAADVTRPETLQLLPGPFDWVVNTVSSSKGGEATYRQVYAEGTRHLVRWLRGTALKRYVYTSSTSVYGQDDGSDVDEDSPAQGASPTSRVLVEVEKALLREARESGFPAVILRVAGIYGPGRGHLFHQYLRDEARLHGEGGRHLNMIHLHDLVGCLIAALERGEAGEIYNAVDDLPVTQRSFFEWLSGQLHKPMPPPASEAELQGRKRGVTHKKVCNAKLKSRLNYAFRYPTFREGYGEEIRRLQGTTEARDSTR